MLKTCAMTVIVYNAWHTNRGFVVMNGKGTMYFLNEKIMKGEERKVNFRYRERKEDG